MRDGTLTPLRPHELRLLETPEPAPIWRGELLYGLCVAVDIEGFSKLDTLRQAQTQDRLSRLLASAVHDAGLDRDGWYRQARGDGELAVVPLTVDPSWVVAHFTDQLVLALARQRVTAVGEPALRLRVAMHFGTLTMGELGPVGDTPIVASRLLDAAVVRRALADAESADLVLVVSDRLYHDVVKTHFHDLAPDRFRPIRVTTKGTTYRGLICVGSPRAVDDDLDGSYLRMTG
jgi:class 3 adenylate cyclase